MGVDYALSRKRVGDPEEPAESVDGFILDTPRVLEYAEEVREMPGAPKAHRWAWLEPVDGDRPKGEDCRDPSTVLECLLWLRDFSQTEHPSNRVFWDNLEKKTWRPDGRPVQYSPLLWANRLRHDLSGMIEVCQSAIQNGERVVLVYVL